MLFIEAKVDGALAASVFHKQIIEIGELKSYLVKSAIEIRGIMNITKIDWQKLMVFFLLLFKI